MPRPASWNGEKSPLRLIFFKLTHVGVGVFKQSLGQLRGRQMKGRGMV